MLRFLPTLPNKPCLISLPQKASTPGWGLQEKAQRGLPFVEGEEESVLPFVMYEEYAEVQSIEVEEGDCSMQQSVCIQCSIPAVDEEDRGEGGQGRVAYKYCT